MKITSWEALCNLGNNINTIYKKAIAGNTACFDNLYGYIKDDYIRAGLIKTELPQIDNPDFNTRCNRLLEKNLELVNFEISEIIKKYGKNKIGIITTSTNSGVEEFEKTKNPEHYKLGNPAFYLKQRLGLKGFNATVSTACSSGLKAFILAKDLLENNVLDAVIIGCIDSLTKVPIYGFNSLEVLTNKPSNPFGKNRTGMNLGEASAIFIVEKNANSGIEIMGTGESSDTYHPTTPDPDAKEEIKAIKHAIKEANIRPEDIDYINAHGTGTTANDIMEAKAISSIFSNKAPVSSTKPLTGHCLGAGAGIEMALCCELIKNFKGKLYPNMHEDMYDESLPKINLAVKDKIYEKCNICMCNSFGFGGTNAIMIIGKKYE